MSIIMIRFFALYSISILFIVFALTSCSEQNNSSVLKDNKIDSALVSKTTNSSSQTEITDELASSPTIIKSFFSFKYYKNRPDTLQVSQYIRSIFQDKEGNLWFGTVGDGVCRYNGESLEYFTTKEGFSGDNVQEIIEDKEGNVWFGTTGGLSKYDGKKFTNYTEKDGINAGSVLSLFIDRAENMWVGTYSGLCRYNGDVSQGEKFSNFPIPEAGKKLEIKKIIQDRQGNIWMATNGSGVYRYDGKNLAHLTEKEGLANNNVHSILQDKNGIIWFATQNGLCHCNPTTEMSTGIISFINYNDKSGSNEFWRMLEDNSGNLWVATRGGLRKYNSDRNTNSNAYVNFTKSDGLGNYNLQSIFEDRAGNIWFGSGAGLFRLNKSRTNHPCVIKTCQHNLQVPEELNKHNEELSKTILNVTKKDNWPKSFK